MEGVAVLGLGFQAQQKHSVPIHLTAASCICAVVTIAYNTEGGWREGRASAPGQRPRAPGPRPCTPGQEDERRHLARGRANWPRPNHNQSLSIMPRSPTASSASGCDIDPRRSCDRGCSRQLSDANPDCATARSTRNDIALPARSCWKASVT